MVNERFLDIVRVESLHARMGFAAALDFPSESLFRPFTEWRTNVDDVPTLRYLYRHFRPERHMEFRISDRASASACLEESHAAVWAFNAFTGDRDSRSASDTPPNDDASDFYRTSGFSPRVCQVITSSHQWEGAGYTPGFFDSAVIGGAPDSDVVSSNTRTVLSLVRPGGLIVWRDFCPHPAVIGSIESVAAVVGSVVTDWAQTSAALQDAFWIRPSFLLAAIRR